MFVDPRALIAPELPLARWLPAAFEPLLPISTVPDCGLPFGRGVPASSARSDLDAPTEPLGEGCTSLVDCAEPLLLRPVSPEPDDCPIAVPVVIQAATRTDPVINNRFCFIAPPLKYSALV